MPLLEEGLLVPLDDDPDELLLPDDLLLPLDLEEPLLPDDLLLPLDWDEPLLPDDLLLPDEWLLADGELLEEGLLPPLDDDDFAEGELLDDPSDDGETDDEEGDKRLEPELPDEWPDDEPPLDEEEPGSALNVSGMKVRATPVTLVFFASVAADFLLNMFALLVVFS